MSMISKLGCAALCAAAGFAAQAQVADDALTLYVSFDKDANADVAAGRDTTSERRGTVQYKEGLRGNGYYTGAGTGCALYDCKGNLNFDQPGTMAFWFKADNWHGQPDKGGVTFWGLGNDGGLILLRLRPAPKDRCPCSRPLDLSIYNSKKRRNVNYTITPPPLKKICSGWHMFAFAWAGDQLSMSFDGMAWRSFKLQTPLSNAEFAHCSRFAIGQMGGWNYTLDEFRIFGKKLSDDELKQLFDEGRAAQNGTK